MSKILPHPILPPPDAKAIFAIVQSKEEAERKWSELHDKRLKIIKAETEDPLRSGWEPSIWKVCDALLGFTFCDAAFERRIKGRYGDDKTWLWWAAELRKVLGFAKPVNQLLILGGNRSGKSEYQAKRGQLMLTQAQNRKVYAFHESESRSIEDQQPLFWKFMPPEWRINLKSTHAYISYKDKTGFSELSFILPNGGRGYFRNYMQDLDAAVQGIEPDLITADELIPPDWVEQLVSRLITRAGKMILGFTPVHGYTPTVKLFMDSAQPARENAAYLLPKDRERAEPADEAAALGLTPEQYAEIQDAAAAQPAPRAARSPQSMAEDCLAWLDSQSSEIRDQRPAGEDQKEENLTSDFCPPTSGDAPRVYERVPRVLRCFDPEKAVVFFHGSDNPYGNPKETIAKYRLAAKADIRMRYYGIAERTFSNIFVKFSRKVHVLPAAAIPPDGTNYMMMDPAGDRNFFMLWPRARAGNTYVYREWPGNYHIPGEGIPGPWAIPSGKNHGRNDGKRGEGQESFGFGLLRYKFEIARLERWTAWEKWAKDTSAGPDDVAPSELVIDWDEADGAAEPIERRMIDSRAASNPRVENDRVITLQTEFYDIGLDFELAPGDDISEGCVKINSALDYKENESGGFLNSPNLFFSDACVNTIYAMENWSNVDGQKGACKEQPDLLRYYYLSEFAGEDTGDYRPRGGFNYGRRRNRDQLQNLPRPANPGKKISSRQAVFSR